VRVVLTAGLLEQFDEDEATRAGCDAVLKKPFEASAMMATIRPLLTEAQLARGLFAEAIAAARAVPVSADQEKNANGQPPSREVDPEQVQAAVTLALDAALPTLIHEITERVLVALGH
jgi:DNA-binding response OmpR family regulator